MSTSHFSPAFLQQVQKKLEQEFVRLTSELQKLNESENTTEILEMAETDNKEDDNALKTAELATTLSLKESLVRSWRDTKNALDRLQTGSDYGVCKYCQKPIDIKRLEARPTSASCVECKQLVSQKI